MKKTTTRIISAFLTLVMIFSLSVPAFAWDTDEENVNNSAITEAEKEQFMDEVGLTDPLDSESGHAYDPFAEMKAKEADEEYRASVEVVAGKILFAVRDVREEGKSGVYLTDESEICKGASLKNVAYVLETVNKTAQTSNGQVAYDVYYEAECTEDVWSVVDTLNETEGVLFAEPDYIWEHSAVASYTEVSSSEIQHGHHHGKLESEKNWGDIEETNGSAPGENVVVAVIDTGVDYTHEDLKNSMWVNDGEIPDNGIDDDENGYIDDYHGYDFIENDGDPMDDNGHGTHVAGIIAMEPNDEGGVGVAYGAKIMAVKAGQANGTLSTMDIAKAITYAAENGADVINMSFGGSGKSSLVEAAVADAFATTVLVAAAGNDGFPTCDSPYEPNEVDMYPAGYEGVIGVMASDASGQYLAGYSNWDWRIGSYIEYEIVAPGTDIVSTIPGNRYAEWDGTSMATPMVAAAAALIRSKYPDKSVYTSRFIAGQLVGATEDTVAGYPALNIEDSLNKQPKPYVYVNEIYLIDSPDIAPENNGDGIVQAGETLDVLFTVKNRWGTATDVTATIDTAIASPADIPNPYVEIIEGTVYLEDIGTYATENNGYIYNGNELVGATNPIRIKIKDDAPNDVQVTFGIDVTCKNAMDPEDTTVYTDYMYLGFAYQFTVQVGEALSGIIRSDMTLTADKFWIIQNSVLIPQGVTVTVEPGTQIQFYSSDPNDPYGNDAIAYIEVEGEFIVNGTEENPVEMFPSRLYGGFGVDLRVGLDPSTAADPRSETEGYIELNYANIINPLLNINKGDHLQIIQNTEFIWQRLYANSVQTISYSELKLTIGELSNSIISNLRNQSSHGDYTSGRYVNVLFDNCYLDTRLANAGISDTNIVSCFEKCAFVGCQNYYQDLSNDPLMTFLVEDTGRVINTTTRNQVFSEIFEYNGSKYLIANTFLNRHMEGWQNGDTNSIFDAEGVAYYNLFNQLVSLRGGHIASINSQEELKFISDKLLELEWYSTNFYLGLLIDPGQDNILWADGTEYTGLESEENCNVYIDPGNRPEIAKINVDGYSTYVGTSMSWAFYNEYNKIILEFPSSIPNEEILKKYTSDEIISAYANCENIVPCINGFSNNAVLSRLLTDDAKAWMNLTTSWDNDYAHLAQNNYWGTDSEKLVERQIIDIDDYVSMADIITDPYLTLDSPELETIYPFVTDAYVTDLEGNRLETVSDGTLQMHVKFNRDMAQDIQPMVTYGADDPYTDYTVEGDWVSSREWVGEFELKTFINQGYMYIRVKGGAAEDKWLVCGTDVGRFAFEISKSGTASMTLQGSGSTGKNVLTWMQDDYETMAGYNIYRSTSYDPTVDISEQSFERVNPYLWDGDGFEDSDVEQGVDYYYYFTVMDTAFNESDPSNVVMCTPVDENAPVISHGVIGPKVKDQQITVSADVTDNVSVEGVTLYYRMAGSENWQSANMRNTSGSRYSAVISAYEVKEGTLEYYIAATDGTNTTYNGTSDIPNEIVINDAHEWDEGTVISYPTCTDEGAKEYKCTVCGETKTAILGALGHEYSDSFTVDKAATCTEAGSESRHCIRCDAFTDAREIAVIPHSYSSKITVAPGCYETGIMVYTCADCGDSYEEIIDIAGHSFNETVVAPTCTEQGYTALLCTSCGLKSAKDFTDPLGHSYAEEITQAPTCTTDGLRTLTCTECGAVKREAVSRTGHSYIEATVPATCTEMGYTSHRCENCNNEYRDNYISASHSFEANTVAATCTQQGYTEHICSVCGAGYTDNYIPALGHSFGAWETVTESTCQTQGISAKTCNSCGYTLTQRLDIIAHSYVDSTVEPNCDEQGYTQHTCTGCGFAYRDNYIDPLGHNYRDMVIAQPALCTVDGLAVASCYDCGEEESIVIEKTGHTYTSAVIEPTCYCEGYTLSVCNECYYAMKSDYVECTEHNYSDEWTVDVEPTETEYGEKSRHCIDCDARTDITPIAPTSVQLLPGDLNGDGVTNSMDSNIMKRVIAGVVTMTSEQLLVGDLNGDGVVNGMDSNIFSRILSGIE